MRFCSSKQAVYCYGYFGLENGMECVHQLQNRVVMSHVSSFHLHSC